MKIYSCANCSELTGEFLDELENSYVICKGIRKSTVIENKIVKYDQPHYSEKKRSTKLKNKAKIIKERKEKFGTWDHFVKQSEKVTQTIEGNKNYRKNIKKNKNNEKSL